MSRLGMIVRMDNTGLGNQTRLLCRMLKPVKLLVVNSSTFNKSAQHPEWYDGYDAVFTKSWPDEIECSKFMFGITHVVTAETVYNHFMFTLARKRGIRIFIQPNWEFLDHLNRDLPQPHKWLMPSYWHLEDMQARFPNTVYLPPPMFLDDFTEARQMNQDRRGNRRFLHVIGNAAAHDRNGTKDILEALRYSKEDYTLVVRSQFPFEHQAEFAKDGRVEVHVGSVENENDLYRDFDAVLLPRRYAGLCLPMNEALASALPVVMPDISPNNKVLPRDWLIESRVVSTFKARAEIDVYSMWPMDLASKIDELARMPDIDLLEQKNKAFEIAQREYSHEVLHPKYIQELGL